VIAIIALLIALLLPALHRAQENGKSAQCLSNMRQIAMAIEQYADDNKGCMPAGGSSDFEAFLGKDPASSFDWIAWHTQIDPLTGTINSKVLDPSTTKVRPLSNHLYAQALRSSAVARYLSGDPATLSNIFRCPSDNLWDRPNADSDGMGAYRYSYSINEYVTLVYASSYDEKTGKKIPSKGFGPWNNNRYKQNSNLPSGVELPTGYVVPFFGNNERNNFNFNGKISSIKPASQIELLLDEDELTLHNGTFNPNPIEYLSQDSTAELLSVRHQMRMMTPRGSMIATFGGNVVFVDGHAETLSPRDALRQIHTSSPIPDPIGF
jgi:prepilin-type processing-associated H-X9-DG protein